MIWTNGEGAAAQAPAAVNREHVGAHALNLCAQYDQHAAEVLHVWFARRIVQNRLAACRDGGHHRVLGAGDGGFVKEDVCAPKLLGLEHDALPKLTGGTERFEGENVGIEPPSANDIAARRGENGPSGARQQRRREENRGADPGAELGVERIAAHRRRVNHQRAGAGPVRRGAGGAHEPQQALDVPNARDILEGDWLIRQERGADNWQGGVLVPGGANGAREGAPTLDNELGCRHRKAIYA